MTATPHNDNDHGGFAPSEPTDPGNSQKSAVAVTGADQFSASNATVSSYIAAEAEFIGAIKCADGLRIAGIVRGDITCSKGDVVIEQGGSVYGNIDAQGRIFVDGSVGESVDGSGNQTAMVTLRTPGVVTMTDRARVVANIEYGMMILQGHQDWTGSAKKRV